MSNLFKCFIKQGNTQAEYLNMRGVICTMKQKTQSVNSFTFQLSTCLKTDRVPNEQMIQLDQNNHVNSEISGILTTML